MSDRSDSTSLFGEEDVLVVKMPGRESRNIPRSNGGAAREGQPSTEPENDGGGDSGAPSPSAEEPDRRRSSSSHRPGNQGPGFRLRRRGRLTRAMESAVSRAVRGTAFDGGKTSQSLVSVWISLIHDLSGAKVTGGNRVEFDEDGNDWLLTLKSGENESAISLGMYVKIQSYACFKPRTQELAQSLRARAMQASKELDYPTQYAAFVLPGTVALAMLVLPHERDAWAGMGSKCGHASGKTAVQFANGEVFETYRYAMRSGREIVLQGSSGFSRWLKLCAGGQTTARARQLPRNKK